MLHDMDLIICRNVFIYFSRKTTGVLLPEFAGTLRKDGYLLTGHNELQGQTVEGLQIKGLPGSFVHQRTSEPEIRKPVTRPAITQPVYTKNRA